MPQLRHICGDILRQDLPQLIADMHQHAADLQQQQPAAGPGGSSGEGGDPRPQDVQQPAAAGAQQQQHQEAAAGQPGQRPKIKVVANLPYYITKDCLVQVSGATVGGQGGEGAGQHCWGSAGGPRRSTFATCMRAWDQLSAAGQWGGCLPCLFAQMDMCGFPSPFPLCRCCHWGTPFRTCTSCCRQACLALVWPCRLQAACCSPCCSRVPPHRRALPQAPVHPSPPHQHSPSAPAPAPQDEVGVRLTQQDPGAADWRAMNILTQYYCRPQYL